MTGPPSSGSPPNAPLPDIDNIPETNATPSFNKATPVSAGHPDEGALELKTGKRPLSEYELVARLGRGGFGEVWRAQGPGGVPVALKFVRLGGDVGRLEQRSLEFMKGVRNPHLIGIHGTWLKGDQLILAMELGDGTLSDRLKEAQAKGAEGIEPGDLREFMRDAAVGIDYLNSLGIQHRDVKPQNLLMVGGGVKVADFGLAKLLANTLSSNSGSMTPAYAAPEFFKGQTSSQSDQYSLAVTYCHLRGGRLPFMGNPAQIMMGHLTQEPDLTMLPNTERPVLARALAKNPEDRWPSCREFVASLITVMEDRTSARAPEGAIPDHAADGAARATTIDLEKPTRKRPLAKSALVLTFCLAALAAWSLWKTGSKGNEDAPRQASLTNPPGEADKGPPPKPVRRASPLVSGETLVLDLGRSLRMELVRIKAGSFIMGSTDTDTDDSSNERPTHKVTLTRDFFLGKYPVTQAEYEAVTGQNPSAFCAAGERKEKVAGLDTRDFPVERVSWNEANAFCEQLSEKTGYQCSLPTEAQWEYACRAGASTRYCFGDETRKLGEFAWYIDNSGLRSHQVGARLANAWGLHDMHGNVWQWCVDWYRKDYYKTSPSENPTGPEDGEFRVLRGGSWAYAPTYCRAALRGLNEPSRRDGDNGFRVCVCLE